MSVRDHDMAGDMGETTPGLLDHWTVDRLLDGLIAPDDAPPGYAAVARLVIAARRPATSEELSGLDLAVAAAVSLLRDDGVVDANRIATRMRRAQRLIKAKVAAVVVVGTIVGTSGLAAANVLPAPIQNVASSVLGHLGVHVPAHGDGADTLSATSLLPSPNAASETDVEESRGHGHDEHAGTTAGPAHATGGKSDEPHGQAHQPHGSSDQPHGSSDQPHGPSDQPHGSSDQPHGTNGGSSGQPPGSTQGSHGSSGGTHGGSGSGSGSGSGTPTPGDHGKPSDPGSQGGGSDHSNGQTGGGSTPGGPSGSGANGHGSSGGSGANGHGSSGGSGPPGGTQTGGSTGGPSGTPPGNPPAGSSDHGQSGDPHGNGLHA